MLQLLGVLQLNEVLECFAFESAKEIYWHSGDSIGWFPYDCDTALVHAVTFIAESLKSVTIVGEWRVVEEYAAVEASYLNLEKPASLAATWQAFEIYKALKDRYESDNGGDDSIVVPSRCSRQMNAIVNAQTCFDAYVPASLTNIFDLALWQYE